MATPVTNVKTPSRGVQRTSKQVSAAGPFEEVTTLITANADGIVYELQNLGQAIFRIYGDGRLWLKNAGTTPVNPVDGQVWFDGSQLWIRIAGVNTPVGSGGGGGSVIVADEGVNLTTAVTSLNFVGPGVTATNVGDAVTITIPGGGSDSEIIVNSLPVATTALDVAPVASVQTAIWDFTLIKGTAFYSGSVRAGHDGTNPYYVFGGDAIVRGTVDVTLDVDINSGNLRVLATPATTGWSARLRRRTLSV